jgi:hypothetical protein
MDCKGPVCEGGRMLLCRCGFEAFRAPVTGVKLSGRILSKTMSSSGSEDFLLNMALHKKGAMMKVDVSSTF